MTGHGAQAEAIEVLSQLWRTYILSEDQSSGCDRRDELQILVANLSDLLKGPDLISLKVISDGP